MTAKERKELLQMNAQTLMLEERVKKLEEILKEIMGEKKYIWSQK